MPLEYQTEAVAQSTVTRFSLVLNRGRDPGDSAHGQTWTDVMKHHFQCRINRLLDVHQPAALQPTPDRLQSELAVLARTLKGNDRLLLYWHDDDDDRGSALAALGTLAAQRPTVPVFVWLVTTTPLPAARPSCFTT